MGLPVGQDKAVEVPDRQPGKGVFCHFEVKTNYTSEAAKIGTEQSMLAISTRAKYLLVLTEQNQ